MAWLLSHVLWYLKQTCDYSVHIGRGNSNIIGKGLPTVVCNRTLQTPKNIALSCPHLLGKALAPPIFQLYTFRIAEPKPHTSWSLYLWSLENTAQVSTHTTVKAVSRFKNAHCWTLLSQLSFSQKHLYSALLLSNIPVWWKTVCSKGTIVL